jgi:hypothetical protein
MGHYPGKAILQGNIKTFLMRHGWRSNLRQLVMPRSRRSRQEKDTDSHGDRTRRDKVRKAGYRDLFLYTERVVAYASAAIPDLRSWQGPVRRRMNVGYCQLCQHTAAKQNLEE